MEAEMTVIRIDVLGLLAVLLLFWLGAHLADLMIDRKWHW